MPGRKEMEEIFTKASAGEKLSSREKHDLDRASRVAGNGYGADARRAKETNEKKWGR